MAAEAIAPVIGKCAEKHLIQVAGLCGGAVAGPAGAAVGLGVGFVVEKAINYFGPPIVNRWLGWLRGKPKSQQLAALSQLGLMSPEEARSEATAAVEQMAPATSPADKAVAIEYLTAISSAVRRSLVKDRSGVTTLPATLSPDSEEALLQFLPTDIPPLRPRCAFEGNAVSARKPAGDGRIWRGVPGH